MCRPIGSRCVARWNVNEIQPRSYWGSDVFRDVVFLEQKKFTCLTRVHWRCCLALSIARSYFSVQHNVIQSVDTLLVDEFDWLIVLWRTWYSKLCWAFQLSRSRTKIIMFWASCIGRPIQCNVSPRPSTFTYRIFEKSDFWPNYPFKRCHAFP